MLSWSFVDMHVVQSDEKLSQQGGHSQLRLKEVTLCLFVLVLILKISVLFKVYLEPCFSYFCVFC